MARLTQIIGALLVVTGVAAYVATAASSVTALIPAFVGAPILICGVIAANRSAHRHAIHVALAIALLGALGSLMNVVKVGQLITGTAERPAAILTSVILFVLCAVYVAFGVRSFVAARRARVAA